MKISYQGATDCFSYLACQQRFPDQGYYGFPSFREAIGAVLSGEADMALLPLENSVAGRIAEVYSLLPDMGLSIVGEFFMPIHLSLLVPTQAVKGLPLDTLPEEELVAWKNSPPSASEIRKAIQSITDIYCLNIGLPSYEKFLAELPQKVKIHISWDTAGAAQEVARRKLLTTAVVAPKETARYNMTILRENIEDEPNNTTRFLMLAAKPLAPENLGSGSAITTLVFKVPHVAGALVKALSVFQRHNINMTKLETYMTGQHHSHPVFYVDIAASQFSEAGKKALEELEKASAGVRILGTYPASPQREESFGFTPVKE